MTRRGFGQTWWGRAWLEALEGRARLDPNRLPRGRSYARRDTVGELVISGGEIRADVQGSRARPYQVRVRVRAFDADEWDRVLDVIAGQVGHAAALLDGELPPAIADDVRQAGTDLLPGPGEVQPRCSCPDWADPCKHAAAVCYLVADVLDTDPFALLLVRGRGRDEVLAGLRSRRRPGHVPPPTVVAPAVDQGVDARQAFARVPAAIPAPPLPPAGPGRAAVLPVDPPGGSGARLIALAGDAAVRAWELASGVGNGGLALDRDADLARRAAALLGAGDLRALAAATGVPPGQLLRWAVAWRDGGPGGLDTLRDGWQPNVAELAEGRGALPAGRVWRNRITCGKLQLRLGQDRLWYRFVRARGDWALDGVPAPDPAVLVEPADDPGRPSPAATVNSRSRPAR